jgi:hypothetical protein
MGGCTARIFAAANANLAAVDAAKAEAAASGAGGGTPPAVSGGA